MTRLLWSALGLLVLGFACPLSASSCCRARVTRQASNSPWASSIAQRPPRLLLAESDETDFCAARVLLARGAGEVAPELAGRSALVQGVRADGVSFQIASELELTVNLTASPPTTPFGSRRLLLGFDLAKWLNGVGVETAAAENGAVTIDPTLEPDALAVFDAQAKSAVALFDDADGNGQLASDNQPPAASAGP